jgi:hypothetical protein
MSGKLINRVEIHPPVLISCDAEGNTREIFAPGETIFVKGQGLSSNARYKLWIQPEPAVWAANARGDTVPGASAPAPMYGASDPSGSQESVVTDAVGDFSPVAIWSAQTSAEELQYDIVADHQAAGTVGTFDINDGADSAGFQGFSIVGPPVQPTALPWDLNHDRTCDIGDLPTIGTHWGETGTAGWIKEDINRDGVVNISDVVTIGLHFGETW